MSNLTISSGRNTVEGFAQRTMHNLETAIKNDKDFHVVSMLASSLLGLIVFPFVRADDPKHGYSHFSIKDAKLGHMTEKGWPKRHQNGPECAETLENLIKNMRHAVANDNIRFSDDSRKLADVEISFENYSGKKPNKKLEWSGSMRGDDLLIFCRKLSAYISGTEAGC